MISKRKRSEAELVDEETYCRLSEQEKDIELQKSLNRIYNLIHFGSPDKER